MNSRLHRILLLWSLPRSMKRSMNGELSHRLCSSQLRYLHLTCQGHLHNIRCSIGFMSFVFPPLAPPPPPLVPAPTPKHPSPTHSAVTQYSKWSRHSTLVHLQRQPRGWTQLPSSSHQGGFNLRNSPGSRPPQSFITLTSLQLNHQLRVGPGRLGQSRSKCHVCVPTTHRSLLRQMLQTLRYPVFGISLWLTSSHQRFRTLPHLGSSCIQPSQSGGVHLGVPPQSVSMVKPIAPTWPSNYLKRLKGSQLLRITHRSRVMLCC
jgi:hypothetical protein